MACNEIMRCKPGSTVILAPDCSSLSRMILVYIWWSAKILVNVFLQWLCHTTKKNTWPFYTILIENLMFLFLVLCYFPRPWLWYLKNTFSKESWSPWGLHPLPPSWELLIPVKASRFCRFSSLRASYYKFSVYNLMITSPHDMWGYDWFAISKKHGTQLESNCVNMVDILMFVLTSWFTNNIVDDDVHESFSISLWSIEVQAHIWSNVPLPVW